MSIYDDFMTQTVPPVPTEAPEQWAGLNPDTASGLNSALSFASQLGVNPEVSETVRPANERPVGGAENSNHYARNGARAADIAWAGMNWGDPQFNAVADHLESQGYNVIRDPHGTGPHIHFESQDRAPNEERNPIDKALFSTAEAASAPTSNSIYDNFMAGGTQTPQPAAAQAAPPATGNSIYDSFMGGQQAAPVQAAPQPTGNSVYDNFMGTQSKPAAQESGGIMDTLGSVFDVLKQPAAAAMDVISYLDKPRGAIAGTVKAAQEGTDLMAGAKQGWDQNTSWKETFNPEWVKENPMLAAAAGLATDVVLDPAWLVSPAKVVGLAGRGAKAIGLTKAINPIVKAVEESSAGKRVLAAAEDFRGVNRVAEPVAEFKAGRAADQVLGQDAVDAINTFKKINPEADAADITKFVEAMPRADSAPIVKGIPVEESLSYGKQPWQITKNEFGQEAWYHGASDKAALNIKNAGDMSGATSTYITRDAETAARFPNRGGNMRPGEVAVILDSHQKPDYLHRLSDSRLDAEGSLEQAHTLSKAGEAASLPVSSYIPRSAAKDPHRFLVEKAIKEGKSVPTEVLKDYPDLQKFAGAQNIPLSADAQSIVKALDEGTLLKAVQSGAVPKQVAFNTLRESGTEIPDFLLQEHQRVAKAAQITKNAEKIKDLRQEVAIARSTGETDFANKLAEELKVLRQESKIDYTQIPEYIYRDQVLAAIPDENVRKQVEKIGNMITDKNKALSDELFQTGRLSPEQVVRFQEGSHLRRSFEQYESPEKFLEAVKKNGSPEEWQRVYTDYQTAQKTATGFGATHKVNMKDFTGRQVLSDDTLKKMGVISDPAYRVMDTLNRGSKTLREDEFLGKVSTMYGMDAERAALLSRDLPKSRQYVPVPDAKGYGQLAGKWIPADVANQVMGTLGQKPDEINKTYGKILSWWKIEKLANPASIARNFYSGIPMANVYGRVPLAAMPKYMAKVAKSFMEGGKNNPLIREIRSSGALDNIWSKAELSNIIGDRPTGIKRIADVGMQAFGAPDIFSRAVVYAYHRDHGMTAKQATAFANKAQFDYSSAPEWVNWLSKTGVMPFAKFPYFAGKATAEALYKHPAEVTKYTKAMNQVNTEDRDKIMPGYLKSKTLLPIGEGTRMVNGRPQKVQNNLDLSYILPFSNDIRLGNPVTDAMTMYATGQNSIGQQVIKPGMTTGEKAKEWAKYAYNAAGPSIPLPGNYAGEKIQNALTGAVDTKGREYGLKSALAQTLLGLKNVPINEQELAKQKIGTLQMQQRDIMAMVNTIAGNKQLTKAQKIEQIADHKSQLKELAKEIRSTNEAWQRIKKRGE